MHESVIREKIIILCLIENPVLISRYIEELGKISFNDINLSSLISKIIEFSVSHGDKELENFNLKSYLLDKGFNQEIKNIFQPKLLNTYKSIIYNDIEYVEEGLNGLLRLQNNLGEKEDLVDALSDLEKKMDEESYQNFIRIKKESLNKKL